MNYSWSFYNPVQIHFGKGSRQKFTDLISGKSYLVVTTADRRQQMIEDEFLGAVSNNTSVIWSDTVQTNPDIEKLKIEINRLRKKTFDAIIAFGGGSSIDSGKVFSIALSETLKDIELNEIINNYNLNRKIKPIPLYAVPTTSGTGSEVTPFATVWDYKNKKKLSLSGPAVFPYCAIVDPALTYQIPEDLTISTGLDAINQAAESIWNRNATPVTIQLAYNALRFGTNSLIPLVENINRSDDQTIHQLRDDISRCSLMAGLCISQTRTALCHSISYPLTVHYGVPHGLACAFTMCAVLKLNLNADDGRILNLQNFLGVKDIYAEFVRLNDKLEVNKRIKQYVPSLNNLLEMSDQMITPDRASNNLTDVNIDIVQQILESAWDNTTN